MSVCSIGVASRRTHPLARLLLSCCRIADTDTVSQTADWDTWTRLERRALRRVVAAVAVVVILAEALAATRGAQQVIPVPSAKVTPEQQQAIDAYATELKRLLAGQGMSMEPLLAAADRITHLLNFPVAPGERPRPRARFR